MTHAVRSKWLGIALLAFTCIVCFGPWTAARAQGAIPWKGAPVYEAVIESKDLKSVLRALTGSQGVTAVIDDEIQGGPISGRFKLTPQSMLDFLAGSNGLIYFYDGSLLYIERASQAQSEVVRFNNASTNRVRTSLKQMGVLGAKAPLSCEVRNGLVRVSGPRAFVQLVRDTVRATDSPQNAIRDSGMRVFKLRYASAVDTTFDYGGKSMRIAGVARLLTELVSGEMNQSEALTAIDTASNLIPVKPYQPKGLPFTVPVMQESMVQGMQRIQQESAEKRADAATGAGSRSGPQIVADARSNSIIVRDVPERMPMYEDLLKTLDVRPVMLEIAASVIEVSTDSIDSLGIDWRFGTRRVAVESGARLPAAGEARDFLSNGVGGFPTSASSSLGSTLAQAAIGPGGTISALLGDAGRFLLARVNALSANGQAKVVSSPRVVTLDNLASRIEHTRTFYVRVPGAYASNLFDVTVGTTLRVTPRVVPSETAGREDSRPQFQLVVQIEDGSLTADSVDQIPVVERSNINTQAFVHEGESLLVAGFTQEQMSSSRSGIPKLSNLPLIGGLFRTDSRSQARVERLFMLTPKLVTLQSLSPQPVASAP